MTEGFRWSERFLTVAPSPNPALEIRQKANILCELGMDGGRRRRGPSGTRFAEEGLALAEQLAEPETLAVALATVARVSFARTASHPTRPPRPCDRDSSEGYGG